jgi:hypothetical protein
MKGGQQLTPASFRPVHGMQQTACTFQTVIDHACQIDAPPLSMGIAQCPALPIACPSFILAQSTIRLAVFTLSTLALSMDNHSAFCALSNQA